MTSYPSVDYERRVRLDSERSEYIIQMRGVAGRLLTVAEMRQQCSVGGSSAHDELFARLGAAAEDYIEEVVGRPISGKTLDFVFERVPRKQYVKLWETPIRVVEAIAYFNRNLVKQNLSFYSQAQNKNAETDLVVSFNGESMFKSPVIVSLNRGKSWPEVYGSPAKDNFTIVTTSGFTVSGLPQPIKQAMLMLVAFWFINRSSSTEVIPLSSLVMQSLTALLRPFVLSRTNNYDD